jgi:hypothetical protein
MPSGRLTVYTPEIALEICRRMAEGESLREICRTEGMPAESTVRLWAVEDREGFAAHYTRAREAQMDRWAEEIVEIADDGSNDWSERQTRGGTETVVDSEHINRSRLRVDTRKWIMAKLAPKRYGDTHKTTLVGPDDGPVQVEHSIEDNAKALAFMLSSADKGEQ